jgi:hypothetical protein
MFSGVLCPTLQHPHSLADDLAGRDETNQIQDETVFPADEDRLKHNDALIRVG